MAQTKFYSRSCNDDYSPSLYNNIADPRLAALDAKLEQMYYAEEASIKREEEDAEEDAEEVEEEDNTRPCFDDLGEIFEDYLYYGTEYDTESYEVNDEQQYHGNHTHHSYYPMELMMHDWMERRGREMEREREMDRHIDRHRQIEKERQMYRERGDNIIRHSFNELDEIFDNNLYYATEDAAETYDEEEINEIEITVYDYGNCCGCDNLLYWQVLNYSPDDEGPLYCNECMPSDDDCNV